MKGKMFHYTALFFIAVNFFNAYNIFKNVDLN